MARKQKPSTLKPRVRSHKSTGKKTVTKKPWRLIALAAGLTTIILFAIGVLAYRLIPLPQLPDIFEVGKAEVGLALEPSTLTLSPQQTSTVKVNLDPRDQPVTAVDLVLNYDPQKLELSALNPTAHLPTVLLQPTIQNGSGRIVVAVEPDKGGQDQGGTITTFQIKLKQASSATIAINSADTMVAAINADYDVLGPTTNLTINPDLATPAPTLSPASNDPDDYNDYSDDPDFPITNSPANNSLSITSLDSAANIVNPEQDASGNQNQIDDNYYPNVEDFAAADLDATPAKPPNLFKQSWIGWQTLLERLAAILKI